MENDNEVKIKILMAKAGLDGHDRGIKVVARALKDAGFEVVYTGVHLTPEDVVKTATDEDVDAIGISMLSGAHLHIFNEILGLIRNNELGDIPVFGGGVIPQDDIDKLKDMGVREIFLPGTPLNRIVDWVKNNIEKKKL